MQRIRTHTVKTAVQTAILLSACLAGPPAIADTVELANGDVLTGTVVAQTDQGVTLKHAILGDIVIQTSRVKAVVLAKPNGQAAATIKQQAKQAAAKEQPATPAGFFDDWKSKLTLGLNGVSGNTDRQNYITKFSTKFEDGRDRWGFHSAWYYAVAEGTQTQNQFNTDLTRDWLQQDSPWFFFIKGQYKYDNNRSWENRASGFGGGGYTLAKNKDVEVNTRLGFGGTYEFGSVNEFTPEALFGGSVIKWNYTDRAAIAGETVYYPSLENSAEFRLETKLEWTYKLDMAKGLSLKVGVENEYDSRTPNEAGNNEVRYYGAVVLSF